MSEDSFERRHGRFVKASDSWQSGVDGAKPGIIMPAHSPPATSTGRSTTCPGGPRRGSCALTQRAADRALRQLRAPARHERSPLGAPDRVWSTTPRVWARSPRSRPAPTREGRA